MCPQHISSLEHQHNCVWDQISWDICGLNYIDLVLFYFYNVYYANCAWFISKIETKLKCFPIKTDGETLTGVYLGISATYNVSSPWQEWNYQIMTQVSLFSSVKFSHSVVSNILRPHEYCSTPGLPVHHQLPEFYSNSCPSSRRRHPAISSSVIPFSSCPQSLQASGSFPMSQLFAWGGKSTGVWASTSGLPTNTQDWSPLGWTGWISLQSKGLSRVFSNTTVQKHQFFGTQLSSQSNFCIHTWPLAKP